MLNSPDWRVHGYHEPAQFMGASCPGGTNRRGTLRSEGRTPGRAARCWTASVYLRCWPATALLLMLVSMQGCRAPRETASVPFPQLIAAWDQVPEDPSEQVEREAVATVTNTEDLLPDDLLTLEECRKVAVLANPDIHAAQARLEGARARIAEARSRFFPLISFTHTSARTFHTPASRNRLNTALQPAQPVPTDIDTQSLAVTTLLNALRRPLFGFGKLQGNRNSFSEHSTSFTISWTIFDGFVREAQLLATEQLHRAVSKSLLDVERLITHAVDSAYYQVQLAGERIRIAEADAKFSEDQFNETQKLRGAGRATRADVDNFRVRVLAAKTDLAAAAGMRETGRVVLAELMGLPDVTLPDVLTLSPLKAETAEEMGVPEVERWIDRAMANRPDVLQLAAVVDAEAENVEAARGQYYPVLAVSGSWGFDSSSNFRYSVEDQSSAAGLELRWDLFTGGARHARVRAAESVKAEAAAALHRLKLAVHAEVRNAIIELANVQEQIRLQRQSLETALENRRIVQAAYLAGKETLTRLNEAQRDFIEAEANLALARIRLRQAWSDLNAAAAY